MEKRSHRNRSSCPEQVRLLQQLLPRPQKDSGLRLNLDLRLLNYADRKGNSGWNFSIFETDFLAICLEDWFMSLDLKDAYFHIQVALHHRRFLRFAFEGVAYQYKVLPFGLSLAPRTFTRCMNEAFSPLRQIGIRILNYLDEWLNLAQLQAVLTSHKTLLLSHLGCQGLRVNLAKSILSPSQRVSFLGSVIDSMQMTATVSAERATSIQRHAASFREGTARSLKAFQKKLGLLSITLIFFNENYKTHG